MAKRIGGRQKIWADAVQRRIAMTSSMLGSMKAVKMMGLTGTMEITIQQQRIRELNLAKSFRWMIVWLNVVCKSYFIKIKAKVITKALSMLTYVANIPPSFVPVATFVTYAIQAKIQGSASLSTTQAFTSLAIITLVTNPAAELLAAIPVTAAASGCFERIQAFLLAPSRKDTRYYPRGSTSHSESGGSPNDGLSIELQLMQSRQPKDLGSLAVLVEDADIRPSLDADIVLQKIQMAVERGSLTMVVGPVGSGKSTLIRAILGELPCDQGRISVLSYGMAYCAQTPWLLNASIQQIICGPSMGVAIDEAWYKTVLHACVLDQDLLQFPDGDRSIIGSRGLSLSGGQKQRLVCDIHLQPC